MADAPARTELKVTTGPIRGSRKIHVGHLGVAMRAVDLEPTSGEPPVVLYDTSGPYTDPEKRIDIMAGLPELRAGWIRARGDVEEVGQREVRPEDNGFLAEAARPGRTATAAARRSSPSPTSASACSAPALAPTSPRCTMRGAASSRPRWNMSPLARISAARMRSRRRGTARTSAPPSPISSPPSSSATRSPAVARSSPTTSTTPRASRWRSAATSWSRSTPISATAPSPPTSRPRSTRWFGRSAGAPTRSWTCRPAATSTTPANGSSATRRCRSAPCPSTRRWRRSAASPRT